MLFDETVFVYSLAPRPENPEGYLICFEDLTIECYSDMDRHRIVNELLYKKGCEVLTVDMNVLPDYSQAVAHYHRVKGQAKTWPPAPSVN